MTYPPFKHFTLMEQTPTIASDSAAQLREENEERLNELNAEVSKVERLLNEKRELQAEVAALKEENERLRQIIQDTQTSFDRDMECGTIPINI